MAVIEMVRGSLRPGNGRSPPFVIIGLVIIIGILGFNYWGLSTLNADLVSQVKKFEKDILKCSEEQKLLNDDTESLRMAVQKSRDNNKELEDIKEQHVAEIADLKSQIKTVEEKLDESTVALDEKVKLEAELEKQLKQLKEENTQLHQELNSERLKAQELASARQEAIHKQDPIKYSHGNKLPFLAREGEEKAGENPELGMPADFHQIPPAQMQVMKDDEEEKSKKQPALPLPPNQWAEKEDGLDAIARNLQKEADREDNAAEEGDQGVEDAKNQLGEDSNNAEEKDEGGLLQDLVGGGGGEKENGVKIVKEGGAYQDFNTMPRGNMEENHANVPPPPLE